MIPFFDTQYIIRRPQAAVFAFLSDFSRYHGYLPEFHGSTLRTDDSPIAEGKVYWIGTEDKRYQYRTCVQLLEVEAPDRFVYEYTYHTRDDDQPLTASEGPMPWDRARVILTLEPCKQGTRVRARMQVYGVTGFLSRWRVSTLKTVSARAQRGANANMVRVAENHIPDESGR